MAFALNAAGVVSGISSANPIQFNHTAGANSKLVVLTLCAIGGGITDVTGGVAPTYNGNNMTQCGSTQTSQEGATAVWYYLSPDASTTRQISITNGSTYTIRYSCSDYTNASYGAVLFGSGVASDGDGADVACSIASVPDGSVCVSCMVHGEKDEFASITGATTLLGTPSVDEGSTQTGAAYSIQSGTGTETHTYVSGGTTDDFNWVMGAWKELVPIVRTVDDSLGITDAHVSLLSILRTFSDSLGITDAPAFIRDVDRIINDQLSITDLRIVNPLPDLHQYTGYWYPHATLCHNGYLYVGCYLYDEGSYTGSVLKVNAVDLSDYSVLSFPTGTKYGIPYQLRYSSTKDRIYAVFNNPTNVILAEIDPSDLSYSFVIDSATYAVGAGSFDHDESYVYIAARTSQKLLKYNMSTWALDDSVDIAASSHACQYADGYLYITHAGTPSSISKVDVSDLSVLNESFATGYNLATDDMADDGTKLWVGFETGANSGSVCIITKANLSKSYLSLRSGSTTWAVQYDGSSIWVVFSDGFLAKINPTTQEYQLYDTELGSANEIQFNGDVFLLTNYVHDFSVLKTQEASLSVASNQYTATVNDSLGVSDAQALVRNVLHTFNESIGVEDAEDKLATAIRSLAESLGLSDEILKLKDSPRTIDDGLGLADSHADAQSKSLSDSVGLTDADLQLVRTVVRSVSDTLGLTDSPAIIDRLVSIAESMGLADSTESLKGQMLEILDGIGLTDSATRTALFARIQADNIGMTDSLSRAFVVYRVIADSLGLTDEMLSALGGIIRTINDGIGLTDSQTHLSQIVRAVADSMGLTDDTSRLLVLLRVISDAMGVSDGMILQRATSIADSMGVSDAFSSALSFLRTHQDDLGISDSITKLYAMMRILGDTVGLADDMSRVCFVFKTIANSLGLTDSMEYEGVGNITRTINNGIGLTDSQSRLSQIIRVTADSMGMTDDASRLFVCLRIISDAQGLTDGMALRRASVISDLLGLTDSFSQISAYMRTNQDDLGMSDSVLKLFAMVRAVSDNVGLTDSYSSAWTVLRTIDDAMGLADLMEYEGIGAVVRVIGDVLGMTDARSKVHIALRTLAESLGTTDSVVRLFAVSRLVSDAEGISDNQALGRLMTISETLGISDSVTRLVGYLRTQNDDVGVLDAILRISVALRTVNDSMGLTDLEIHELSGLIKAAWAFIVIRQTHS